LNNDSPTQPGVGARIVTLFVIPFSVLADHDRHAGELLIAHFNRQGLFLLVDPVL
jgi:hypothetical protein